MTLEARKYINVYMCLIMYIKRFDRINVLVEQSTNSSIDRLFISVYVSSKSLPKFITLQNE